MCVQTVGYFRSSLMVQTHTTQFSMSSMAVEDVVLEPAAIVSPITQMSQQQQVQTVNVNELINKGVLAGGCIAVLAYLILPEAGISHGWTVQEFLTRVPVDAWEKYSHALAGHPIFTKACTSATVYTIGDVIAQRMEGAAVGDLDRMRIARSMTAGLIGHGPLSHCWYNICDGFFANVLHLTAWWAFIPKVVIDQTVWGPIWNNTYILLLGLMKMERLDTIWNDMKRSTIPLFVSGLKLWPAAHVVTYGFIPVENRLLWVDLVEILWVTVLATQAAGLASTSQLEEDAAPKTATMTEL